MCNPLGRDEGRNGSVWISLCGVPGGKTLRVDGAEGFTSTPLNLYSDDQVQKTTDRTADCMTRDKANVGKQRMRKPVQGWAISENGGLLGKLWKTSLRSDAYLPWQGICVAPIGEHGDFQSFLSEKGGLSSSRESRRGPPGAVRITRCLKRWAITGAGLDPSCAPDGFPSTGSDDEGCWGRQQTRKPTLLLRLSGVFLLR